MSISLLAWPGARLRAPAGRPPLQGKEEPARNAAPPRRRSPGWATPLPEQGAAPPAGPGRAQLRGERGERAVAPLPARSRVLPARSHPRGRGPRRAVRSRRPQPFPGPFRRPPRARSAPLRAALPYRALPGGRDLRRGSGAPPRSARAPRGPPHTRGGDEEAEELRPAGNGSGRGCALPGSPPGGEERGGCHRPSCTASRVLRPRGIAGAAAATERRDAHVGPAPRSPTLSRRRPAAQGPTARCGARQHAALAGLRAAAERRAQRRLRRGEYAGAAPPGCAIGCTRGTLSPGYAERDGTGLDGTGSRRWGGAGPPLSGQWGSQVGFTRMPGCPAALRSCACPPAVPGAGRPAPCGDGSGAPAGRAPQRSPTARHRAPLTGEGIESTHPPGTKK